MILGRRCSCSLHSDDSERHDKSLFRCLLILHLTDKLFNYPLYKNFVMFCFRLQRIFMVHCIFRRAIFCTYIGRHAAQNKYFVICVGVHVVYYYKRRYKRTLFTVNSRSWYNFKRKNIRLIYIWKVDAVYFPEYFMSLIQLAVC